MKHQDGKNGKYGNVRRKKRKKQMSPDEGGQLAQLT